MGESAATSRLMVLTGNANPALARAVCADLGVQLGNANVGRFPDGEIEVKVHDDVRGADVFIIQPTCAPPNETLMELLLLIDSVERASAHRVTAVMPYYGYARKDRKDEGRVPIAAKVVANMLVTAGVDRVLTMDLHAPQIQGFFSVPVDHLYARTVICDHIKSTRIDDLVVCSPDAGFAKSAAAYANLLGVPVVIGNKTRPDHSEQAEILEVIGQVEGRNVLMVDDFTTTGGSLCSMANVLKQRGAKDIYAAVSHGVLSKGASDRIQNSLIAKLFMTDTIESPMEPLCDRIEVISVAPLFAQAIRSIHDRTSVSMLFPDEKQV